MSKRKQQTPKGLEIPVPKREDVLGAFRKVAGPPQAPAPAKKPKAQDA